MICKRCSMINSTLVNINRMINDEKGDVLSLAIIDYL
jgi:hypothetical protein